MFLYCERKKLKQRSYKKNKKYKYYWSLLKNFNLQLFLRSNIFIWSNSYFSINKKKVTHLIIESEMFYFSSRNISLFFIIILNASLISKTKAVNISPFYQAIFTLYINITTTFISKRLAIAPKYMRLIYFVFIAILLYQHVITFSKAFLK